MKQSLGAQILSILLPNSDSKYSTVKRLIVIKK